MSGEKKRVYRIGEAAREVGVKPFVLRFWESEFPRLSPRRTGSGQRVYSQDDVDLAKRIKDLLHHKKLTIEGARKQLAGQDRTEFLQDLEDELREIRKLME